MALELVLTPRLRLSVGCGYCGRSDGAEYCTAVCICMTVVAVKDVVVVEEREEGGYLGDRQRECEMG